jgi:hypothetical protein
VPAHDPHPNAEVAALGRAITVLVACRGAR